MGERVILKCVPQPLVCNVDYILVHEVVGHVTAKVRSSILESFLVPIRQETVTCFLDVIFLAVRDDLAAAGFPIPGSFSDYQTTRHCEFDHTTDLQVVPMITGSSFVGRSGPGT